MSIVYLGIGSNLGDRRDNIEKAIAFLKKEKMKVLKLATLIETEPVGGPKQGKFLNSVVKIQTELEPQKLLKVLKSIENQMGRVKTVQDGPRPIDLDILLYDNLKLNTPSLTIPHPRMLERDFVLIPLKEIADHLVEK